ncbi:MAG: sulfite exporter TauE/SafE family protein [Bacteroidetes bacterium]|nr:sulfite exporter TauE/SafE family protein [Bacteroidota bacterium]
MEFLGYLSAVVMGILLGLIGGGGSILTVPILVYLFNINPVTATAYSLFIVGTASLIGSYSHFRRGFIDLKIALVFGAPSIASVWLVRAKLLPAIPENIFQTGDFLLTKSSLILLLFAVLMLGAALTMIFQPNKTSTSKVEQLNYQLIFTEGFLVGGLTGLVGAGGGFLIIPALILFAGLPMKHAVGTSLLIIAAKSLIGFTGDLLTGAPIDYRFLLLFSGFAIGGILVGSKMARHISDEKLRPIFGWFVLLTGMVMLWKEL